MLPRMASISGTPVVKSLVTSTTAALSGPKASTLKIATMGA